MKLKIIGLFTTLVMMASIFATAGTVYADSVNSVQTAESISLNETRSVILNYGEFNEDYYFESGKYYSFVAPYTGYFNFTLLGWKTMADGTSNATVEVTDKFGKVVDYGGYYNQYYNDVISVAECEKGKTYYVEIGYYPYNTYEYELYGNATTTLSLTITPHTHDFNIEVYSFATYYDCKRCNYSYSKKANTILPARTTRSASAVSKDKSSAKNAVKKAKIKNLKAKSKAKKKITVSWKRIKKADGYQVQVSKKRNFKKTVYNVYTLKKKLTIQNNKIKSKKIYYVRVRAYATYKDAFGNVKMEYGKWIDKVKKVKVK